MPTELRSKTNQWIRSIIGNKHFGTVLNLGCGSDSDKEGREYSQYFHYDSLIKIDKSPKFEVDYVASAEKLPISDNSIDFLFMNWVIYKTNIPQALREIERVLRSNAKVLISYADPSTVKVKEIAQMLKEVIVPIEHFALDYIYKGIDRRAEIIYGRIKS
jgi:SAM-dependent methyltransferase